MENTPNKTRLVVLSGIVVFLILGFFIKSQIFGENKTKKRYDKNQDYKAFTAKAETGSNALDELVIEYVTEANTVALSFPTNQPNPVGKVTFFHPSKTNKDRVFDLKTDPSKRMYIRHLADKSRMARRG
jgi:hypothetical protein